MLLAMLIWSLILALTFEFSRIHRAYDYRAFFKALLGNGWILFEFSFIAVAMLAQLNPLAVIPSAIFLSAVYVGSDAMSRAVNIPTYMADVLAATSMLTVSTDSFTPSLTCSSNSMSVLATPSGPAGSRAGTSTW